MKKNLTLFFCVLTAAFLAQSYRDDVLSAYKTLRSTSSYSMCLEYKLFLDGELSSAYQKREVEIKKENENIFMKQSNGVELLFNSDYYVFLDSKKKILTVMPKSSEQMKTQVDMIDKQFEQGVDTSMQVFETVKLISDNKLTRTYECIYKNNPVARKMTVSFNKKTKLFLSVITEMKEAPVQGLSDGKKHKITIQVKYQNFSRDLSFNQSTFNTGAYLERGKNGKIAPVSKFSKYQFIVSK